MSEPRLAIKIDVDTDRGTRLGVPALADLLAKKGVPATFLFSLGPDNTGRAIRRIFRPGFFSKVSRTSVVSTYGLRTLMNGVVLPGPHIARKNRDVMKAVADQGFETGIHCWDHVFWQDKLFELSDERVMAEFQKAMDAYEDVFGVRARTAGAAGWQANAASLAAYDAAGLDYATDARGRTPFFPTVDGKRFKTLQIPTTLPTLDELMGRPEYPTENLVEEMLSRLASGRFDQFTIHAEIEGMSMLDWFADFLDGAKAAGVCFVSAGEEAQRLKADADKVPVVALAQGTVDGRSGTLAVEGAPTRGFAA
jgi:peptidoglycan/xylan/chitin deacetylase (PgdA/CDA1 family)